MPGNTKYGLVRVFIYLYFIQRQETSCTPDKSK